MAPHQSKLLLFVQSGFNWSIISSNRPGSTIPDRRDRSGSCHGSPVGRTMPIRIPGSRNQRISTEYGAWLCWAVAIGSCSLETLRLSNLSRLKIKGKTNCKNLFFFFYSRKRALTDDRRDDYAHLYRKGIRQYRSRCGADAKVEAREVYGDHEVGPLEITIVHLGSFFQLDYRVRCNEHPEFWWLWKIKNSSVRTPERRAIRSFWISESAALPAHRFEKFDCFVWRARNVVNSNFEQDSRIKRREAHRKLFFSHTYTDSRANCSHGGALV